MALKLIIKKLETGLAPADPASPQEPQGAITEKKETPMAKAKKTAKTKTPKAAKAAKPKNTAKIKARHQAQIKKCGARAKKFNAIIDNLGKALEKRKLKTEKRQAFFKALVEKAAEKQKTHEAAIAAL